MRYKIQVIIGLLSPTFSLHTAEASKPSSPAAAVIMQSALPDTGQTVRYTLTFGEDADFAGHGPAYIDNGDGTVTDSITGLMWQKTDGGEMTWEKASEYALNLTLANHNDWRLPNSVELFSIMNHGKHGPAMDTEYFSRSDARYWWTNTSRSDEASKIWVVNTGGGIGAHSKSETISAGGDRPIHVRCVRGESSLGAGPSLKDNGDGTVTDQRTGLIWQKVQADKAMSWEEALQYCENLNLAHHADWRLPNIKELRSVNDDSKVSPSLDKVFFPGAKADFYWSSTSQWNHPERAWYVDFSTGLVTYADKAEQYYVLAVRGGKAFAGTREKTVPDPKLFAQAGGDRGPGRGKSPEKGKGKGGEKGKGTELKSK
jgi:hypothetical protein